jgi:hypothetical protein
MKISILAVALIVSQSGFLGVDQREEAAVYADYIDGYYITRQFVDDRFKGRPFSLIVINGLTAGFHHPFSYQEFLAQFKTKLDKVTISEFLRRNDGYFPKSSLTEEKLKAVGRYPINPFLKFSLPHTLISTAEMKEIFDADGRWEEFYRRYPSCRGIVWLSRVGFNKNKSESLLYFGHQYDEAAGDGRLILLRKADGKWKGVEQVTVWIS